VTTWPEGLASTQPRIGIFLRLEVEPMLRLWLGVGDCRAGIDATDGAGEIYLGLGTVLDLPAFQQLVNGTADRLTIGLSGVDQRVGQMATVEADEVKNTVLRIGVGLFDADWQTIGAPRWLRRFVVDYLSVARGHVGERATWTVSLSARSFLTGRRRPGLGYWSDHDQQQRSPGDRFCERTSAYSADVQKAWPRF
jgi:hypothetical protein